MEFLTFVDSGEGHQTRAIVGDYQNNFHVEGIMNLQRTRAQSCRKHFPLRTRVSGT